MSNTTTLSEHNRNALPDRLTVFTFLWACQAIVHQDYYSAWMHENDPRGWMLTILATGALLLPRSLPMFAGMLACSVVYNVVRWPFVVNHILVESIINLTILSAILVTLIQRRGLRGIDRAARDEIFQRFAPVIVWMLVLVYWFAFIAKLNTDFMNPDTSCVVAMYGDLLRRFPFLPNDPSAHKAAILMTLVVEALIPLFLTIRRTRPLAILIGIPFHVVLGLVGHRTFSALAFALYVLICMDGFRPVLGRLRECFQKAARPEVRRRIIMTLQAGAAVGIATLVFLEVTGESRTKVAGIIRVYQISYLLWCTWSLIIGSGLVAAMIYTYRNRATTSDAADERVRPGLIWSAVPLVVLLGLSQYIGIKTETCFTMYSNLRTEGEWNNHLFMPALRLGGWQTDLVDITETNHPELQEYVERGDLITFFEIRRIVAGTSADVSFFINYERNGQSHRLSYADHAVNQTESWGRHPMILGKLLFFRPVPTGECAPCRH